MRGPPNRNYDRKSRKEQDEGERLAFYNRRTLHSSGNLLAPIGSEPQSTNASQSLAKPNGRVAKSRSRENNPKTNESNSQARKSNIKTRDVNRYARDANPYAGEVIPNTRLAIRNLRTDDAPARAANPTPRAAEKKTLKNGRNILKDHLDEKYQYARAMHDGKAPSSHSRPSSTMQTRMRAAPEAVPLVSRGMPYKEVVRQRMKINLDLPIEKPNRKSRYPENAGAEAKTPSQRVKREKLRDKTTASGKKSHPAVEEARRLKEELLARNRTKNNNSSSTTYETVHHVNLPDADINHALDANRQGSATCCNTKMAEIVQQQISAASGIAARNAPLGPAYHLQKSLGVLIDNSTDIREFSVSPEYIPLGRCRGSVDLDIKSQEAQTLRSELRKSTVLPRTEALLSQREQDTNALPPSRNAVIETIDEIKRKRQVYTPRVLEFIKSKFR